VLRARLDGGIRNKAARGELRRGLPVGLVWGEADGEILKHPDEAVTGVIAAIFGRFAVCGSVRGTWLWLRDQGLKFPLQPGAYIRGSEIIWTEPTYHAVHNVLTHPAYAGAYTFGRSRQERSVRDDGTLRVRRRVLPQDQWEVLIKDHHPGFIGWDTYQANQAKIRQNIRPVAHQPGTGAVREGCALLQGLATCGTCGRKLAVYYDGEHKATPGYYCTGTGQLVEGRGTRHLRVGGVAIDQAVAQAFLAALEPVALQACLEAARQLEHGHDAALEQHRRQVEQARYQAARAERRYQAVDPDNRLVARGLENAWEKALTELAAAETELTRRQATRPATLTAAERAAILALGDDLQAVWDAPTTTDKDRKQLCWHVTCLSVIASQLALRGDRRLQDLLGPLAEAGRSRVLRGALDAVVNALVLRPGHVGHPLSHRIGHAEADEPLLVGLERVLLEPDLFPEHVRHDLGHVVEGQILGSEQRDLAGAAPACVEQQARSRGGDVAGGDRRQLAVARDRREEHALVPDRRGLADRVVHERGIAERPECDAAGSD